jgi:hypothetical protein
MTVVGKILVFLNLIFSVAVGVFAVMSYAAGSNYKTGYEDYKKQYAVVVAAGDQYKKENEQLRDQARTFKESLAANGVKGDDLKAEDQADKLAKRVAVVIQERNKTIEDLKGKLKVATEGATKRDEDVRAADDKSEAATTAVSRRGREVEDMRKAMAELSTKNGDLTAKLSTATDARVQAELKANTLEDQVRSLEESQRDLMRELARMRTPVASARGGTPGTKPRVAPRGDNPPPDNIEATVKKVSGDLITISAGRDAGLEKGNTLQVFRLGTAPRYIGKILIVEVQAKQAVGQVQGRLSTSIRVNDKVASSILGGF